MVTDLLVSFDGKSRETKLVEALLSIYRVDPCAEYAQRYESLVSAIVKHQEIADAGCVEPIDEIPRFIPGRRLFDNDHVTAWRLHR